MLIIQEGVLVEMASPDQRYIRYRTSAALLHCIDDIDADHPIPSEGSFWTWENKCYKVIAKSTTDGAKNQIPVVDIFVEETTL